MKKTGFTIIAVLALSGCGTKTSTHVATNMTSEMDFSKDYSWVNEEFGTKTLVTIKNGKRSMKTNALPNHTTGEFPNEGNPNSIRSQTLSYDFPMEPTYTGTASRVRQTGVALNGIKFEPGTAERFECESGEVFRVEAFQDLVDMGLDFSNAHVQPTGAYHYHGVPLKLVEVLDKGEDIIHVGFAADGFKMYYSKSGKYKPSYELAEDPRTGEICSYRNPSQKMTKSLSNTSPDGTFVSDWMYEEGLGDLDECNGITLNGEYAYFVTKEYPYVGRCLMGDFTERRPQGPPPGGGHRPPRHG